MRIAYITFEYPPDTAVGGIATYAEQVARIMVSRGHDIEVFCASTYRTISEDIEGIKVHRINSNDRAQFNKQILPSFEISHAKKKFDIIESPEYYADGLEIKLKYPEIPLTVKLHSPSFLISEINNTYFGFTKKSRFIISGLVRGKLYKSFWRHVSAKNDPEYLITRLADQIQTPSISLGDIVSKKWNIQRHKIHNIPNPFIPGEDLLNIPLSSDTATVTYVGRLEVRKGLVELCKAIAIVLKKRPLIKFRFVGRPLNSPVQGLDMKMFILNALQKNKNSLEFLEVLPDQIARVYAQTDICVFPSIWENFPNTCLEAMSAGRGIVASKSGGMHDMLRDSNAGLLVDPLKFEEIAKSIILLLDNKSLRMEMGHNARNKVLKSYSNETIGVLAEAKYMESIEVLNQTKAKG
ncbi:glycosyltransferase family 4 protein [Flavihumibacter sp. R14]|nr:glycosyltransferase family 4 protein [Flavihumibacter soli]